MKSRNYLHDVFMEPCIHLNSAKPLTPLASFMCSEASDREWPELVDTFRNKVTHEWLVRQDTTIVNTWWISQAIDHTFEL